MTGDPRAGAAPATVADVFLGSSYLLGTAAISSAASAGGGFGRVVEHLCDGPSRASLLARVGSLESGRGQATDKTAEKGVFASVGKSALGERS